MAKRMQEQKRRPQDCGKIVREKSDCIQSPGILDARARRNAKPDAASSSQGRLKDAYLGGLMVEVAVKPAATDKSQESWEFS